ncbi:MAG: hypothetical protein C5B49_15890 [Bdellovibrio sp.]|nr:MAG: hypothetical protein C5B49_15890 [Bdellovibrio sp.]
MNSTVLFIVRILLFLNCMICPSLVLAQTPTWNNLSQSDLDGIMRDFGTNMKFSSVSPASSLGHLFGFEVGAVVGLTRTPNLDSVAQRVGDSVSELPHVALLGALSLPLGLTAEIMLLPKTNLGGGSFHQFGGSFKWTLTDSIPLPFDLALKAHYSSGNWSFSQTINNASTGNIPVTGNVSMNSNIFGGEVLASVNLLIFEPYIGVGTLQASGNMTVDGTTGTIFDTSFGGSQSGRSTVNGFEYFAGAILKLAIFHIGLEYSNALGDSRYDAKLSLAF